MDINDENYPLVVEHEGIKLKTEKMISDQLYHCIYNNKVYLFYKDQEGLLHCYEVDNIDAAKEIVDKPTDLENILKKYARID
jgi:hypothetical protein